MAVSRSHGEHRIPSSHTSMRSLRQCGAFRRVFVEDRVGVVDVDQHAPRRRRQLAPATRSCRRRPTAADGRCRAPTCSTAPRRGISSSRPEGAVDQHAIAARHGVEHLGRDRAQPRCVERAGAARDVADQHADVVARHRVLAVRRVRRGLARPAPARAASDPARRESGTRRRRARCGGAARRSSASSTRSSGKPVLRSSATGSVHHSGSAVPRSRSMSRPVEWSTWPSISTTAAIAVSRTPRFGCSAGLARICSRMSGEALNRMPSRRCRAARRSTIACAPWPARCPSARRRSCGNCSSTAESRRRRRVPRMVMRIVDRYRNNAPPD